MRAIVIGAGIGGLTTALSLHAAKIDVVVFETVKDIRPLGQGINLQPNGVRELMELGLGDELAASAIETSSLQYHNKFGQTIWAEPRGLLAGYKWPQYSIQRGDLQALLLRAVRDRIGEQNIRLGCHLHAIDQDDTRIEAHFRDSEDQRPLSSEQGDVLIGVDGINSTVRGIFYPDEPEPVKSGNVQWRGAAVVEPFLDGRTQVMIGHRDQRVIIYPMSRKVAEAGESMVNWVAGVSNLWDGDKRESWDRRVDKQRFFERFSDWRFDWIDVAGLIEKTEQIFEYPEVDRTPLEKWTFGRATLLGDAAHPMRPVGSQAGTQAIIDARVLARALAHSPTDPERGLLDYERQRLPAMNEIILRNRQLGPEIVMQMAEERAPSGFTSIDKIISSEELERISSDFKRAAGFDPATLNNRVSLNALD